jgi:DNA mismatch endonuclease, patch repair protein
MVARAASYIGLKPASARATRSARGASAKRDTKPELKLRAALRAVGLRGYRVDATSLPGRPDVVFTTAKVAVFCDGDFWHGRNLNDRLSKLESGHNAPYWVKKISGNVARDRRQDVELAAAGWFVLRFWESDVHRDPEAIASQVHAAVSQRVNEKKSART